MVAAEVDVTRVVSSIVAELQPVISVAKIILFGSCASGAPKRWSDIDVAIVSLSFSDVPLWRRQEMLAELLRQTDVRLSPLGYSPEELSNPEGHSFLREIIRTGRVVYEAPAD